MTKKVYINPGHSDRDPGAVGFETERRLTVAVSNYQRDYLLANYDVEVMMNPGTMGDLYAVCREANAWGAHLFTSNHFNAGKGDGYEAYVYSMARVELGKIFAKHVAATGQNLRSSDVAPGVKIQPSYIALNSTTMPAVLNECAFVDNLKDIQDWNEDVELKAMGVALAKAAAEYLELEAKQQEPVPVEAPKAAAGVTVNLSVLQKGSTGEQVEALQRILHTMGYDLGTVNPFDGNFGAKTDAAVRAFQQANGLTVDGIVGQQTWNKLLGVA